MKKILFILFICSCKSYKPTVSTITICDEIQIKEYVKLCLSEADTTNARDYYRYYTDCSKQAREIYCKPVKVLNVRGTLVKCDDAPDKYKKLCK